ncbi:hypothetical protein ES708_08301 [subsurface metagenome]
MVTFIQISIMWFRKTEYFVNGEAIIIHLADRCIQCTNWSRLTSIAI